MIISRIEPEMIEAIRDGIDCVAVNATTDIRGAVAFSRWVDVFCVVDWERGTISQGAIFTGIIITPLRAYWRDRDEYDRLYLDTASITTALYDALKPRRSRGEKGGLT